MTDIVFIHGLWIAHSAWQPWIDHFAEHGHQGVAPAWPGEADTVAATRENPAAQAGFGIDDLTEHFAGIVKQFDTPPVVIGHSFGGLIAQKLLGQNLVAAAVAIDPAPIKGVRPLPVAQLRSAFPVLGNPLNRGRAKALSVSQFRYGFGNALTAAESDQLWEKWAIPSPGKPLFEAGLANFTPNSPAKVDTANATRGPLLITAGTADHTVPHVSAKAAFKQYAKSTAITEFHEFDGRGHSLTIDHGWRDVADTTLAWLASHNITGK
ncbi:MULTISPECIES: alpha/beta hydrolase [Mycobacteriaceae]|jgi:pimeloyl-ACP methyl ester carboxylesterase|uniref:Ketoacyl reductase n=1 Tax=Mycolicibacterium cosmeticum TaxID=258533 RepID=W9AR79_MYCCO|nr:MULTISPECIES: alpha/beta fold hydrolase [Mycobacteriaceae]TLH71684.1 alpha/beta hydrolase [Mycolicibacterium cosmeticum]GAY19214.1 alpha/beta hydrolase [Mycobacterium sp. shizuoka-1]GCA97314.1 alpha/beta hydrolase [Mycolicibacterium sp. NCC-Tsukiji]CDO07998.1 ketoacyl reductase [Mycolicibacterium cosmeticum]